MAFIYRDYVGPLMGNFVNNTALYHLFDKAWPSTQYPASYDYKLIFYIKGWFREDFTFTRFLNKLNMTVDKLREENYDEINSVYFYMNPGKTPNEDFSSEIAAITPAELAQKLDSVLVVGDKVNVMTTYGGETEQYIEDHEDTWEFDGVGESQTIVSTSLNTDAIRDTLLSDRWMYYANVVPDGIDRDSIQYIDYAPSPEEFVNLSGRFPIKTTPETTAACYTYIDRVTDSVYKGDVANLKYFTLAMLDDRESCFKLTRNEDGTPKLIEIGVSSYIPPIVGDDKPVFDENGNLIVYDWTTIDQVDGGAVTKYTFGYEYEYIGAPEDAILVNEIVEKIPIMFPIDAINDNNIQDTIQKTSIASLYEPDIQVTEDPLKPGVYVPVEGTGGWYPYFDLVGDQWFLNRARAANMKRYEFANMISDCLDTDYSAEGPSLFERIISVVIVILAVIIAFYAPYLLGVASGGLAAFSAGVGLFSLVITIGNLVLSQMGLSAQGLVRIFGQVAQITGIVAMVTGVMASIQSAFTRAALAAGKTTATYTVGEFVVDFAKNMVSNIKSAISGGMDGIFNLITDTQGVLLGTAKPAADLGVSGWLGRLSNGIKMYDRLFEDKNGPVETPNQEQMEKRDFQHPEQMYQIQEEMIYEPDALEKIDILKEQQNGGRKTEELMQRIA